jgi:hypothetical protein
MNRRMPMTSTAMLPFHKGLNMPTTGPNRPRSGSKTPHDSAALAFASVTAFETTATTSSSATSPFLRRNLPLPPFLAPAARTRGTTAVFRAAIRSFPKVV